ncbi:MAG: allC [Firmicutes bacterium]|nr:allC [Bacillota bacterium]
MSDVSIERVRTQVRSLSEAGRTPQGGVTRLTYSPEYRLGMQMVTEMMQAAGMEVHCDPVGNLIGVYWGKEIDLPAVMTGSHLDSVPEGGELDGALGVMSAIECVRSWHENKWRPRRTVKVVATIEEEGTLFGLGCFGSRALAGELCGKSPDDFKDAEGRTLAWHMKQMGLEPDGALQAAVIDPREVACFVEFHIEQGEELILSNTPCAVVTDIIGIDRHWIVIQGTANHAGTTRMDRRQDALVAAAALISEVNRHALASQGQYVATVGKLELSPNATNVIPGRVMLCLETRGAKPEVLEDARANTLKYLAEMENRFGVKTEIAKRLYAPPVPLSAGIIAKLKEAAEETGVRYVEMPSWAGHDAKIMATIVPTGMIFVPSVNGSHTPQEDTRWEYAAEALKVLNQALKKLAE